MLNPGHSTKAAMIDPALRRLGKRVTVTVGEAAGPLPGVWNPAGLLRPAGGGDRSPQAVVANARKRSSAQGEPQPDRVVRIHHLADGRGQGEHRHHMLLGAPPSWDHRRVALVPAGFELVEPGRHAIAVSAGQTALRSSTTFLRSFQETKANAPP